MHIHLIFYYYLYRKKYFENQTHNTYLRFVLKCYFLLRFETTSHWVERNVPLFILVTNSDLKFG